METPSATATAPSQAAAAKRDTKAVLSSDFETFLKMLSTQLQNQDPLNPVDSADYAVQLATFSSVEQQVLTNTHLAELTNRIQLSGMSDLANWVGMEALTPAGSRFDGTPVSLHLDPPPNADRAVLVVRDDSGTVVHREDTDLSTGAYDWDGRMMTGATAPVGTYSFELETSAGGEPLSTEPVASYARVVEARWSSEGTMLILSGGGAVASADVLGLRL
ncbi:flagellar hook capping FlgD N-terminal domain-containing protein [Pseudooceanicola sp.]|uniref:flagellar hook capping FlgD N-terminal domain-containing protein n=1 Tax=Pseudooceanicola sp. TaxID=1914328 RepID=UPI0035C722C0